MRYGYIYKTILGNLCIVDEDEKIVAILFENVLGNNIKKETKLIKETIKQLNEYFEGKRKTFSVPIYFNGTDFQNKVWNELLNIPYGKTISYGELAKRIGNPKASRAVGMANHNNPISIIVPCHRVIGKKGQLVGYGGGLDVKQKLLEIEGTLNKKLNT